MGNDTKFKQLVGDTYKDLSEIDGYPVWDTKETLADTIVEYTALKNYSVDDTGKIIPDSNGLKLVNPLEDWRSTPLNYYVRSSEEEDYKPVRVLQPESVPDATATPVTFVNTKVTDYIRTESGVTHLLSKSTYNGNPCLKVEYDYKGTANWTTIILFKSKENSSKYIIPNWVIFELQAGGGGGGGSDAAVDADGNDTFGSGGGGGGFITGLLKLDFDTFSGYEITIGAGGAGGNTYPGSAVYEEMDYYGKMGGSSSITGIYLPDATGKIKNPLPLVTAIGGQGGVMCVWGAWSPNGGGWKPVDGGSVRVDASAYVKAYTIINGGKGGVTYGVTSEVFGYSCDGGSTGKVEASFTEITSLKTNSYFKRSYPGYSGGRGGGLYSNKYPTSESDKYSGGGGASALSPGGDGGYSFNPRGGNYEDCYGKAPTTGYGGGGGGGFNSGGSHKAKGGNGGGGYFSIRYGDRVTY